MRNAEVETNNEGESALAVQIVRESQSKPEDVTLSVAKVIV